MNLSGLALVALKSLYEVPNKQGDLAALLQQRNARVTVEQAQAAGRELEKYGCISSTESGQMQVKREEILLSTL